MSDMKGNFRSSVTEEWYKKAEDFEPTPGVDYSWVFDYARHRFDWAYENGKYIEEKAVTLFKFDLAIAAGFGGVFSFFASHGQVLSHAVSWLFGSAISTLLLSGISLLLAFDPSDHLYPIEEEAALLLSKRQAATQDSRANLSLALTASTEFERLAVNNKARWMRCGLTFASLSTALFILGLFAQLLL